MKIISFYAKNRVFVKEISEAKEWVDDNSFFVDRLEAQFLNIFRQINNGCALMRRINVHG